MSIVDSPNRETTSCGHVDAKGRGRGLCGVPLRCGHLPMQRPENAIVHLNLPGWILSTVSTSVLLVVLTLADSAMASTGGATRPAVSSVAGTGGATLNAESDRTGGAAGASAGGNYGKAGEIGCWSKSSSFGSGTSEFLSKTQWALLLLLLIVICRKGLKGIATALAGRFETAEGYRVPGQRRSDQA